MDINVTFRHMNPSDALKDYAESKFEKFKKYLHEPIEVHAVLQVQKIRQLAEVTVKAKHFRFHGMEESQDMYASIDLVAGKIERHLKKHKEKVKDHKSVASTRDAAVRLNGAPSPASE
jgi:ribosome hibernation promoting factor